MRIVHYLAQIDTGNLPKPAANSGALNKVLMLTFGIVASISLLVIVIGGLRYILAHGDPNSVSQAKKAILYAIIGLLVSFTAMSIITFVIKGVAA